MLREVGRQVRPAFIRNGERPYELVLVVYFDETTDKLDLDCLADEWCRQTVELPGNGYKLIRVCLGGRPGRHDEIIGRQRLRSCCG